MINFEDITSLGKFIDWHAITTIIFNQEKDGLKSQSTAKTKGYFSWLGNI